MVDMALTQPPRMALLFDEDRKAVMASNLMAVRGESEAPPVLNTGSLQ